MVMLIAFSLVIAKGSEDDNQNKLNQAIQTLIDDEQMSLLDEVDEIGLIFIFLTAHTITSSQKEYDGANVRRLRSQPAPTDGELLWEGLFSIKGENERWKNQTVQLFGYSPEMISRYGVRSLMRVQTSNQPKKFRDFLITNANEAVFEEEDPEKKGQNWGGISKIRNLYDVQKERYTTLQYNNNAWSVKGKVPQRFNRGLVLGGAIEIVTHPIGELLWTGSADLVFDVTHDYEGWGLVHPHHQVITRSVEILKITNDAKPQGWEPDYALFRWARHPTSSPVSILLLYLHN